MAEFLAVSLATGVSKTGPQVVARIPAGRHIHICIHIYMVYTYIYIYMCQGWGGGQNYDPLLGALNSGGSVIQTKVCDTAMS